MKVALLWNGDKSSAFSYSKSKGKFDISFLLTFLREEHANASFLSTIKSQCRKLGVPFFWDKLETAHLKEYAKTFSELKEDFGIEGIVTSDGQGMIEDACKAVGMEIIRA